MLRHRLLSLLLLPLLFLPLYRAAAQLQTGNVQVHVTYPDDRTPTTQLKVDLIGGGNQIAETYTNDNGQAQFQSVAIGTYQVTVTGQGIQSTTSEMFVVDPRRGAQSIFVRVQPTAEGGETKASKATVSANDLKVPKKASQEFDKASKLIVKQQWQKAIDQLNKALALYPSYAEAYNNLGVVYARLGDTAKEREALDKAVAADEHFAPAFVNLARLEMKEHNFAAAEAHLNQASASDPTDPRTLTLLAQAQLLDQHYQDAIASASKVHSMARGSFPLVHYVAARACEKLNRLADAVSQLKLFLNEEPAGDRAAAARQEMAAIEKQLH